MAEMMTVLRVEDENGFGPFHAVAQGGAEDKRLRALGFSWKGMADHISWMRYSCEKVTLTDMLTGSCTPTISTTSSHPHHEVDILNVDPRMSAEDDAPRLPGRWLVGVKDEAQLHHWFDESALAYLARFGFAVVRYSVPATCADLREGKYQLMFRKAAAKRVA